MNFENKLIDEIKSWLKFFIRVLLIGMHDKQIISYKKQWKKELVFFFNPKLTWKIIKTTNYKAKYSVRSISAI